MTGNITSKTQKNIIKIIKLYINRNIMKWLLKVNTRFLLINFTLELVTVNTNLDMVTDLTENTAEKITKITKIKIGS